MKVKSIRRLASIALVGAASAGTAFYLTRGKALDSGESHPDPIQFLGTGEFTDSPIPFALTAAAHVDTHQRRRLPELAAGSKTEAKPGVIPSLEPAPKSPRPSDKTDLSIADLERQLAALKELKLLKERNRLITLADRVIITGSRSDFATLEKSVAALPYPALSEVASLQVLRVDRHFYSRRGHRGRPLPVPDFFAEKESEDELTIGELLQILIDGSAPAEARIRAAELLGQTPKGEQPRLPGYLLYTAENADDLDLIDEALVSYGKLTGVYPNRMFDVVPAAVWWDFNNPEKASTAQSSGSR